MPYDRYDNRDQNRGYRDDRQRDPRGGDREERGFFDRAIDSVTNFFGDDDERSRQQGGGERPGEDRVSFEGSNRYLGGSSPQRGYEPQAYDQGGGRQGRDRENDRFGVSDRSTTYSGGQSNSYARGRDEGDYKNQYGRGGGESGGFGRGNYGHQGENYYSRQGQDHGDLRSGGRSYPSGYGQTGGGSYRETQHQQFGGRSQDDDHQSGRYQAQGSDRNRPMTGDRSSNEQGRQGSGMGSQDFRAEQYGRQDFSQDQNRDRSYNYGGWGDRDSQRQSQAQSGQGSGFMGAAAGAASSMFGGGRSTHDEHYHSWRQRQIEELDRDYDEYRREHQSRFENEFHGFRQQRQTKRQMLQSIREHFEVVDESGQHVGTVDKVRGDKIILTKNDPEAGGVHRSFTCSLLERVEDNKVYLSGTKNSIRSRLTEEHEDQYRQGSSSTSSSSSSGGGIMGALFGSSDDRGQQQSQAAQTSQSSGEGPHMLDKSFSGTYDDDSSTRK
jgi:hypothetical protein